MASSMAQWETLVCDLPWPHPDLRIVTVHVLKESFELSPEPCTMFQHRSSGFSRHIITSLVVDYDERDHVWQTLSDTKPQYFSLVICEPQQCPNQLIEIVPVTQPAQNRVWLGVTSSEQFPSKSGNSGNPVVRNCCAAALARVDRRTFSLL